MQVILVTDDSSHSSQKLTQIQHVKEMTVLQLCVWQFRADTRAIARMSFAGKFRS